MGLAVRDDIGPASLPDPVEQAVESRESLTQRPFIPGQKITARLGVRTASPGDAQAARGPVAVIDRVLEVTGRGVEVREQRQGMPAVHRADDLSSPRRHWSDDEPEP